MTAAVVGITPQMGLNFALYETFKSLTATLGSTVDSADSSKTQKDSLAFATLKKGFCGGAAGGISKLVVYPLVRTVFVAHCLCVVVGRRSPRSWFCYAMCCVVL